MFDHLMYEYRSTVIIICSAIMMDATNPTYSGHWTILKYQKYSIEWSVTARDEIE